MSFACASLYVCLGMCAVHEVCVIIQNEHATRTRTRTKQRTELTRVQWRVRGDSPIHTSTHTYTHRLADASC